MASQQDICIALLKDAGQSITKARMAVFAALERQEPLTMHELVERVRGTADRASVYRTVELFERLGITQRVTIGWKYKVELSDRFAAHHHHLTCINCGRTIALNEHELEQFIERVAAAHHFRPSAHQIEVQGLCATCQPTS